MDEDRLKHSIAVARKMIEIGRRYNLNEFELQELFVLGFNHDIGYDKRLEDIKNRYGEESKTYCDAKILIEKLRGNYNG